MVRAGLKNLAGRQYTTASLACCCGSDNRRAGSHQEHLQPLVQAHAGIDFAQGQPELILLPLLAPGGDL